MSVKKRICIFAPLYCKFNLFIMKKLFILLMAGFIFISSCDQKKNDEMSDNPLLLKFDTPHGVPDFDKIKDEHFLPAFKEAMKVQKEEIDAIVNNEEAPSFENTIAALDFSGDLLNKVSSVFYPMKSANTNDSINAIAKEIAPMISKHRDDISLNEDLFKRVKAVHDKKDELGLNTEQAMLLKKVYDKFVRGGANLPEDKKARFREINEKLSMLSLQFGDNILKENNSFELIIEKEEDLSGLPETSVLGAKEAAEAKGYEGKWLFTLHKPSLIPFITYADKRELREKIYKGYINRGDNNNEYDNKEIIKEIVNLRVEKANLLGYDTYADFVLENNMAKTPDKVFELLNTVWEATLPVLKEEAKELQAMIDKEGNNFKLESWDWWYYSEKIRKEKYDLDEEAIRPYFSIENVKEGMFLLADKLFGIKFEQLKDFPTYHDEALVYEVKEADDTHIGIFYIDPYPRESKRGGAWMTSFRKQSRIHGKDITPVIMNVTNFSKPVGDKPALLSFDEVMTAFHEFGHGLHGLLSNCTYTTLSGTSVPRDFVELPSQIMENWAAEPEMLKLYAKHYETGEVIPDELIEKIQKSSNFNQGFITGEYTAAAILDMNWHIMTEKNENIDVNGFETEVLNKIGLIPEVISRYRSTYFSHIFSGGYSAGYYVYQWAAVLDADAFEAFKENGLFDKETAKLLRDNIISRGSTDEAMNLYKAFRGKEPSMDPFLKRLGFI
jgi:peptidyl-dipeptidase Dcp